MSQSLKRSIKLAMTCTLLCGLCFCRQMQILLKRESNSHWCCNLLVDCTLLMYLSQNAMPVAYCAKQRAGLAAGILFPQYATGMAYWIYKRNPRRQVLSAEMRFSADKG